MEFQQVGQHLRRQSPPRPCQPSDTIW
jgi:hypothetical protein